MTINFGHKIFVKLIPGAAALLGGLRALLYTEIVKGSFIFKVYIARTTWDQCYNTFYSRMFKTFVISQSVCSWQAFPAFVCGQGQEPTQTWSTLEVFHLGRLLTYLKMLYYPGNDSNISFVEMVFTNCSLIVGP
jgi:hypothetical protein